MARLNTKRMMNILASDKKKMEAAAARDAVAPTPQLKEATPMDSNPQVHQLEIWLADFLQLIRDANRRHEAAIAAEEYPNAAIQDILHILELAPSKIEPTHALASLTELRRSRRRLKQELEVSALFREWVDTNKVAVDKLTMLLGNIRKVLNRQPNDAYRLKTGVAGIQGEFLQPDPRGDENENS